MLDVLSLLRAAAHPHSASHPLLKGKPEVVCENPHCAAAPSVRPALHIEDRDPIPEEQVRVGDVGLR